MTTLYAMKFICKKFNDRCRSQVLTADAAKREYHSDSVSQSTEEQERERESHELWCKNDLYKQIC